MSRSPTPQAISALLRKAGFERSTVTRNTRHHKEHTAGFHVRAHLGEVLVNWWSDTTDPAAYLAVNVQQDRETGRGMRARYAKVITEAGWVVEEKSHILTVTAPKESR